MIEVIRRYMQKPKRHVKERGNLKYKQNLKYKVPRGNIINFSRGVCKKTRTRRTSTRAIAFSYQRMHETHLYPPQIGKRRIKDNSSVDQSYRTWNKKKKNITFQY
ncbi:hypothetical protein PUN28_018481 [Cardiocondyla obscurior]|uniref:Uncharacterized protein n=1 Tax=Cardiocondyla obscurior TaxID=286306 RepID=A0AAW2EE02_9HYME